MNKDRYKELIKLRDNFLDALNAQAKLAKTQEDYDDLESITEDVFNGIPLEIVQCDYITRNTIRSYLDNDDQKDMHKVNKFMKQLWNDDVFHLDDDNLCDDLQYATEKFYKSGFTIETQTSKGKFYGYVAEHPEEPWLPYYSEEPDDAIVFETMQDAQDWIDTNSEGTDFNFIIINKKD